MRFFIAQNFVYSEIFQQFAILICKSNNTSNEHGKPNPINQRPQREKFQKNINGKYTDLFLLQNAQGHEVAITNYGGTIVGIMVPDKTANWQHHSGT